VRDLARVVLRANLHVVPYANRSLLGDAVQHNGDALRAAVHPAISGHGEPHSMARSIVKRPLMGLSLSCPRRPTAQR
jgi:hypothetical protein